MHASSDVIACMTSKDLEKSNPRPTLKTSLYKHDTPPRLLKGQQRNVISVILTVEADVIIMKLKSMLTWGEQRGTASQIW